MSHRMMKNRLIFVIKGILIDIRIPRYEEYPDKIRSNKDVLESDYNVG